MSGLILTLREAPPGGLDLSALTPLALAGKSRDQIARLRLRHGGHSSAVKTLFDITGAADGETLQLRRLTAACHRVGHAMAGGVLEISGHVGNLLGGEMRAGEIRVAGNAGDAVGQGMRGGVIRISGNTGERTGGAVTGQTRGMNDGVILIRGNAGDRLGERMRRGLIIVLGDSGAATGERMIAGTIAVFGQCGAEAGCSMRRGTLLLAHPPHGMPAGFNDCGIFELGIAPLLRNHVAAFDKAVAKRFAVFACTRRWCGDMAWGGKGEMLIAAAR